MGHCFLGMMEEVQDNICPGLHVRQEIAKLLQLWDAAVPMMDDVRMRMVELNQEPAMVGSCCHQMFT